MKIDLPTGIGIGMVLILCIFAVILTAFENNMYSIETAKTENSNTNLKTDTEILNKINQQAIIYQKQENQEKFDEQLTIMKEKQVEISSKILGIRISDAYVEESWNFPFRSASEIEPFPEQEQFQVCNIPENIPLHLQNINDSEMFHMFAKKYSQYPLTIDISDERRFNSTVHYSLVAKSLVGNHWASTWFHLNSCTGQIDVKYNLSCGNYQNDDFKHTRHLKEIVGSLESKNFCKIHYEPWRQALFDYEQILSKEMKKHRQKISEIEEDPSFENVMVFHKEMDRIGLLRDIVGHAMNGNFDDQKMQEMKKEYNDRFGDMPKDLLKLIENEN